MKKLLKISKLILEAFRDLFIGMLPQKISRILMKEKGEFAFLVHPRDLSDVQRKYPFMKNFPNWFLKLFIYLLWPVICSQVTGLKRENGEEIKGWIIGCPLTADQMLRNRKLAKKRILKTARLAEKLGVKIIGLGALTSSLTNGGLELINRIQTPLATGNSYTAAITLEGVDRIIKEKNMDLRSNWIAIVGATGSIGEAVSKILANRAPKLILIGRTLKHLYSLEDSIRKINQEIEVEVSTDIRSIIKADIVIVATSSTEALIKEEHLKIGAVVYDVTQPQNVSPDIAEIRKDVLVIDGGLVETPGINFHFNFGLPREITFACLAETMLLALEGKFDRSFAGRVKINQVKRLKQLGEKYGFKSTELLVI